MRLGVIADDLTGAADTGVQFAKRGFYTILFPFGLESIEPPPCLRELQIAALSTATRGIQARLAHDTVKNATALLKDLRPQSIYKKIDSTLRGNIGTEIEAVMEVTGEEAAMVAPAFPAHKRTTVGGIHFVNGKTLSRTEVASDPVSPVDESHIPTLVRSQTKLKVGHIGLEEVRHGPDALRRCMFRNLKDGERIIVLDAVTDSDLRKIAEAGMSISFSTLMVGSAGLASQLFRSPGQADSSREHFARCEEGGEGVVVIISGSLSSVTSEQLSEVERVSGGKIIPVSVHRLIVGQGSGSGQGNEIVSEIMSAMKANRVVGIQSVRESNPSPAPVTPSLITEYLGRIALQIVRNGRQTIRGLILTGGDTALAVLEQLGISQLRLMDEVLPDIPYGEVVGGDFVGLPIVTKAGAFGDGSALVKCIDFLNGAK